MLLQRTNDFQHLRKVTLFGLLETRFFSSSNQCYLKNVFTTNQITPNFIKRDSVVAGFCDVHGDFV